MKISNSNSECAIWGIGSTGVLTTFLNRCARQQVGHLFFTAPFYDAPFLQTLIELLASPAFTLEALVNSATAAQQITTLCSPRPIKTLIAKEGSLHAKVFVFECRLSISALIGSHNPTISGLSRNLEVGVLASGYRYSRTWQMIFDLRECLRAEAIRTTSSISARSFYVDCRYVN